MARTQSSDGREALRQLMHVEIRKFEYSLRNFARSTVFCETMFRASCSVLGAKSSCSQVPCSEWGVKSSCSQVPCSVLGAKSSCSELHVQAWGSKVHVPSFMFHVPRAKLEGVVSCLCRFLENCFSPRTCVHTPVPIIQWRCFLYRFFFPPSSGPLQHQFHEYLLRYSHVPMYSPSDSILKAASILASRSGK